MKTFPAAVAQIEWEDDRDRRLTDIVVFDRTKATELDRVKNERRFSNSHGACVADWMSGDRGRSTPEGQFIEWVRDGFSSPEVMLEALDQLGQIEEAGWARTMAQALRERLRQERGHGSEEDDDLQPVTYE